MGNQAKKKRSKKKKIILALAAVLLAGGLYAAFAAFSGDKEKTGEKTILTGTPTYQDIVLTVSGSGTVSPYDRYEIVPMVSGDIIACGYEEGDIVSEGDLLYVFDHSEQDKSITSARNSITKADIRNKKYLNVAEYEKELAKYTVRAAGDGVISGFTIKAGDNVTSGGRYGNIQNRATITAKIPFNAAQCEKIAVGDQATVYLMPSMYTVSGTVAYKSTAASSYNNGAVVYDVEITVESSHFTLSDTSASATVYTAAGRVESPKSGTVMYDDPVYITPDVSGEVSFVPMNIKDGATVKKGDVLFEISKDNFLEEKKLAEFEYADLWLALENAQDRLDNYNITAPISGTVITKNYKKGDTITGNNATTLMVIADMSAMKFTFQADETDVDKLAIGQDVQVTADAVANKVFFGKVTKIATEGISANGVSYYDVEVVIDDYGQNGETGSLRSGMNVSAEIIYQNQRNAFCVPVSAVHKLGSDSFVFVKDTTGRVNAGDKEAPVGKEEKEAGDARKNIQQRLSEMAPEGFTAVRVETGVTDGTHIAILSGLNENDTVYLAEGDNVQTPVSGMTGGFNGGFGGGMNGGPRGGMGGAAGMPRGGMG